jgi:hypothetical protein
LRDLRPELPAGFVAVVEKAVEDDPKKRFSSAGEMEAALSAAQSCERYSCRKILFPLKVWLSLALAGLAISVFTWRQVDQRFGTAGYSIESSLYRTDDTGSELLLSGSTVRPGDKLHLELQSSQHLYVYVLNRDERGESFLLFPLVGYERQNPLPADEMIRLPGSRNGQEVFWQVTSAGAKEYFLILASPEQLMDFEEQIQALKQPTPGHPVVAGPLSDSALKSLRGIGGLVEGITADRPGPSPVFETAQRLAASSENVHGIWAREIVLKNPSE